MNQDGTILYRGLTPYAIGLDLHGGYGETWSRGFEGAKGYAQPPHGYILQAVLHPSARQLVLVTEVDDEGFSDYVEDEIRLLAGIVGDPWVYESLMSGRRALWEVWEPEWTEAIKKAGYDSIFTGGFDGPEEYVLNISQLRLVRCFRVLARDRVEEYPIEGDMLVRLGYVVEGKND